MNFSFELQGAAMTGNINPEAMMGMSTVLGAFLGGLATIRMIACLAIAVFMIISRWRLFKKAGLPGWGILIPGYNLVLMFQLGGLSGRWALSLLFPPLLLVMMIINSFYIAEKFGKTWAYGLGILFLKVIFIPILAFDDSKYLGRKATKQVTRVITKPEIKPAVKAPIKKVAVKKPIAKAPAKKVVTKKPVVKAPAKKVVTKKPVKKVKTITKKK